MSGSTYLWTAGFLLLAFEKAQAQSDGGLETRLPAVFVENCGQWPEAARFHGRIGGTSVWVEEHAVVLQPADASGRGSASVRLVFEGTSKAVKAEGEDERPGLYNYFFGDDPSNWVRGARSFRSVRCNNLYRGIDFVLRSEAGTGRLKYDLFVAPEADLEALSVRCEGILGLHLDEAGALVLETAAGPLFHAPGSSWQVLEDGTEIPVECRVELRGKDHFGFRAAARDPNLPLVVDPGLVWSTYLGSPSNIGTGDLGFAVAFAPDGDVIAAGGADWFDFPTTPGSYQHPDFAFGHDVFVTRFRAADGELLYSSIIGGPDIDRAHCIATDEHGRAYVAGEARRAFPTTLGTLDTQQDAVNDSGFLLRMGVEGDLEYSTFVEGSQPFDFFRPEGIAIDRSTGSVVLAGRASGSGLPATPGAFDTTVSLAGDGFIARLDSEGTTIEWASYLGGTSADEIWALDLDELGRVVVTGTTRSTDFPTTPGVFQPTIGAPFTPFSVFVTIFAPAGDQLVWSSLLGASGAIGGEGAGGMAIAFDPSGGIVVGGGVGSDAGPSTFPVTAGALQPSYGGEGDGFLARFSPDGSSLVFSTFLGSSTNNRLLALSLDRSGVITVAGTTRQDWPVSRGAFDTTWTGVDDAFLARLDPNGTKLLYSTYFGGAGADYLEDMALTPWGRVAFTGTTTSTIAFPTTPWAPFPIYQGGQSDAFVSVLDLLLEGVRVLGRSTPACNGPLLLHALEYPKAGLSSFGFYLSQAPSSSSGWLYVGQPASVPTQLLGVGFLLDGNQPIERIAIQTDAVGYVEIPRSLVSSQVGTTFAVQALVRTTNQCSGQGEWSASNALGITVQ